MKKTISILVIFLTQLICNSQTPIQVNVTGQCTPVTGTYLYTGLVNGKNNYAQTFVIEGVNATIAVGFDGIKWVLYANNDLTDPGFINLAINGVFPPLMGWSNVLPDGCPDGTMTISTTLSTETNFKVLNGILLFPNPSTEYIIIADSNKTNSNFKYKIIDSTDRIVGIGESKFDTQIPIENLASGNYFIHIINTNGTNIFKKFLKK